MRRRHATLLALLLLPGAATRAADVLTVPGDHATIQAAIDAAADGDEIRVAAGTWFENVVITGKDVTLRAVDGAAATVIDGGGADSVVTILNGPGAGCVVDGFTIRNGGGRDNDGGRWGGGVYIELASPTLRNCVFRDCTAAGGNGGGVFAAQGDPVIDDCEFLDNQAFEGGGFACEQSDFLIRGCTFRGNTSLAAGGAAGVWRSPGRIEDSVADDNASPTGGGISLRWSSTTVVDGVTVRGNEASSGGGFDIYRSAPRVVDCVIEDNVASDRGGGLFLQYAGEARIERCIVRRNAANDSGGGGIYAIDGGGWSAVNTLLHDNTARSSSGAGVSLSSDIGSLVNCTVARNDAGRPAGGAGIWLSGGSALRLVNCTLWGNTVRGALHDPPGPVHSHTQIDADHDSGVEPTHCNYGYDSPVAPPPGGGGNFGRNPLFRDAAGGDFRLLGISPNIDSGTSLAPGVPDTDLDGRARPQDGDGDGTAAVDIGAFEHLHGEAPVHAYVTRDGRPIGAAVAVEPVALGGGQVLALRLVNGGAGPLALTGTPPVHVTPGRGFAVETQPASPLAPGAAHELVIAFTPVAPGPATATVTIAHDAAPDRPLAFDVVGDAHLAGPVALTRARLVWPESGESVAACTHRDDLQVVADTWATQPARLKARWKLYVDGRRVRTGRMKARPDGSGFEPLVDDVRLKLSRRTRKRLESGALPGRLEVVVTVKLPRVKGKTKQAAQFEFAVDADRDL